MEFVVINITNAFIQTQTENEKDMAIINIRGIDYSHVFLVLGLCLYEAFVILITTNSISSYSSIMHLSSTDYVATVVELEFSFDM